MLGTSLDGRGFVANPPRWAAGGGGGEKKWILLEKNFLPFRTYPTKPRCPHRLTCLGHSLAFLCLAIRGTSPCPTCHLQHAAVGGPFSIACFGATGHQLANNVHCKHKWYLCFRAQWPLSPLCYALCPSAPPWPLIGGKSPHAQCMGREPGHATGGPRVGTITRHGRLVGAQVYCGPHVVNLPTRPFRFPCHRAHVHYLTLLDDGPCVVRTACRCRSTCAPYLLWMPWRPHFQPAASLYTIKPWKCHRRGGGIGHLPHNDLVISLGDPSRFTQWRSKPVHKMQIQGRFTQWRSNPLHTMEIQARSHNGRPSRFTQWISKASSHNGDPCRFTQWRSKPVHTMKIQSPFTQCGSKLAHKSFVGIPSKLHGLCLLSSCIFNGRHTFSKVGLLCGALFVRGTRPGCTKPQRLTSNAVHLCLVV